MISSPAPTHFGIDLLLTGLLPELAGCRVGLVTSDAATTSRRLGPLQPSRLALLRAGVDLVALFSPEHGLEAAGADGAHIDHSQDTLTGLPVYSLYGDTFRPTQEMLAGLDLVLVDLPDVGARFYTYIWTLSYVMEACAATGLPLWILDRPNPIGGDLSTVEGPELDESQVSSFVGRWSIPIRHSLTIAELARLWNYERHLGLDLHVVLLNHWRRSYHWPEVGTPFVPTSPNLPSYETALLYPGTCLFEGTNLSEGRGTAFPFQVVGAPWLDHLAVAESLDACGLAGLAARPMSFVSTSGPYARQRCAGVMLHVLDAHQVRPVRAGLHLLAAILHHHPADFAWRPYPTADSDAGYGHFDRLIGRLNVREALAEDSDRCASRIAQWTQTPDSWSERVRDHLLY